MDLAEVPRVGEAREAPGIRTTGRDAVLGGADEYESDPLPRLAANTRKAYRTSITRFRAFFVDELDNPAVDGIRAPRVRKYLRWRESRDGIGPRTLACLHAVFTYAVRDLELIEANPVSNVKPPKHDARDPVILDDAQFEALLNACDVDDHGHKLAQGAMLKMYTRAA